MRLNIAESIREVLCDRNPVSIYGLGTLCLTQTPAQYGEQRTSLLPPQMKLDFTESSSSNDYLSQWLVDKYDISAVLANEAIKTFSESVLNVLLNYGSARIHGVALLSRDKENQIICKASDDLTSCFYKSFPEVSLIPPTKQQISTDKGDVSNEEKIQELEEEIAKPKNTTEKSKEIKVEQPDEPDFEKHSKLLETDELTAEDMIVFDLESEIKKLEKESQEAAIDPNLSKPPSLKVNRSRRRIFGYFLLVASVIALMVLGIDACRKMKSEKSVVEPGTQMGVFQGAIANDSLAQNMLEGSEMNTIAELESCIIITGVFSSELNVDKMDKLILEYGYEPYTSKIGIYTRVGLQFDCGDVDLEDFIQKVRSEISPKAWYLNPELYVAYQ